MEAGRAMLTGDLVEVSADPPVRLFAAQTEGPAERVLLVVHGGPDWDHTYLRQPLAGLAGRYRLVFPDLRGCGRSTRGLGVGEYSPDAAVADLLALLDALGVRQADVLGFSYGGLVAQRLALAAPRRVRRLVIAASGVKPVPSDAYDDWPEGAALRAGVTPAWLTAPPTPQLVRDDAVAAIGLNVWRAASRPEYLRRVDAIRWSAEWARVAAAGLLPPALPGNAQRRLAAAGWPILIMNGRWDLYSPAKLAEQAAAEMPNARAVVLPDAGHMAHIDQPRLWLAALEAFLTSPLS